MLGLDHLSVVVDVVEQGIVFLIKQQSRECTERREDVTRRGSVFAAVQTRAKLSDRLQQIQIVAADEILRQINDRAHERRLAVMIRRQLGHRAGELRDLDLFVEISLETREQHLTLTRLESVHKRGYRTLVVEIRE